MNKALMCLLSFALLLVAPVIGEPQNRQTPATDLGAELESYSHYVDDFHAAEQGTSGQEFAATDYLQSASSVAFERVLAIDYTLRIYRTISCTADRVKAKEILRQQLYDNAFKFKNDANQLAEMLKFLRVPVTAQLGLKLKDEMRTTKDKLDKISSALD